MAQSVTHPTSAQVMISQFVGSSPTSGSVLEARSLEPASDFVSPSLSALPLLTLCLSLSKINKHLKKIFKRSRERERILSRLLAQCGSQHGARSYNRENMT